MSESCTTCGASPPAVALKRCAKCNTTPYCSRDCQKADWKSHKRTCGKPNPSSSSSTATPTSPTFPLTRPVPSPFTRLDNGTYLHALPPQDVYTLLIDAHRLRLNDMAIFEGVPTPSSAASSPLTSLRAFLAKAQATTTGTTNLLPAWWNPSNQQECEQLAQDGGDLGTAEQRAWLNMSSAPVVDKASVTARYGSPQMPMQLRMLAEAVYGRGLGGMSGTSMRKMMASMEAGGTRGMEGMVSSVVDLTTGGASRVG